MKLATLALLAETLLAGCATNRHQVPALGSVTSVTVSIRARDGSEYLSKIADQEELSRVVTFIDAHAANWTIPWYGVPVPSVRADLFDGNTFKGSFGVGDNFFETQRDGGFYSQSASPTEAREFRALLGVDDQSLKRLTN